jgi:hypothetical protein
MFPDLPGDPPLPETGVVFCLVGLLVLATGLLFRAVRGEPFQRKRFLRAVLVLSSLAVGFAVPIAARNFGRWSDLRAELRGYGEAAASYEREFGRISSDAEAERFHAAHPTPRFSFGEGRPSVEIVYLWWHTPPRPGIIFGRGGTAAFHLRTMICVYSD